jgi:hypothetical protein
MRFFAYAAAALLCAHAAIAQTATVLATGLQNPMKVILGPRGNLLVAENGKTPNSGRVSIVDRSGNRRTVIDGLPSGLSSPNNDPDGVTGLAIQGRTLYIVIGEGDTIRSGSAPGTQVPNPAGVSSPLFSSLLRLRVETDIDRLSGPFHLTNDDQLSLADGNDVSLTSDAADKASIFVITDFRDVVPDPVTIYRNSHPFGISFHSEAPDSVFIADAGRNTIWRVPLNLGRQKLLTRFAPVKSTVPGPPFSDAVPDSIHAWDGQLLVTLLTGFPFTPGQSRVMRVDPLTGETAPFIVGLNSAIDVAVRQVRDARPQFWVLEFSANQSARPPLPGRLLRYDTALGTVVLNDLVTPTSIALDAQSGDLFITEMGPGVIKQLKIR